MVSQEKKKPPARTLFAVAEKVANRYTGGYVDFEISSRWALNTLDKNTALTGGRYTAAASSHYLSIYDWDLAKVALFRAWAGDIKGSWRDLNVVLDGLGHPCHEDGFIPNCRKGEIRKVGGKPVVFPVAKRRRFDPEDFTFLMPKFGSDYTQPPLLAEAAEMLCQKIKSGVGVERAASLLDKVYPKLKRHYLYFLNYRTDKGSSLVGIIHPHESGRDRSVDIADSKRVVPTQRLLLPRCRLFPIDFLFAKTNSALHYLQALQLGFKEKALGWKVAKIKTLYWVKDVAFNCHLYRNLMSLGSLAFFLKIKSDAAFFKLKANQLERDILSLMWREGSGPVVAGFYALNRDKEPIYRHSVSGLFPLLLPSVSEEHVSSILDLLGDPRKYQTDYPVPSIPADDPQFDPHYRMSGGIWRGGTWIDANFYLLTGLREQRDRFLKQGKKAIAERCNAIGRNIARKSVAMVAKNGAWEFYNPLNGAGQRVKNLSWTAALAPMIKAMVPDFERWPGHDHLRGDTSTSFVAEYGSR